MSVILQFDTYVDLSAQSHIAAILTHPAKGKGGSGCTYSFHRQQRQTLTFSPRLLSEVSDFPHMIAPPILSFGRAKVLNVCSKSNTNNYKNKICFYYKQLQINIFILHLNSPDINAKTSLILLRRNSNTCQALKMFTVNDKEIKYQGVGTYKFIVYHFRVLISLQKYHYTTTSKVKKGEVK